MENLKAEQIKKALECFHQRILDTDLAKNIYEAEIMAIIDALSLIKSQEQEIANLHASCTEFEQKCASLNDENERLRVDNDLLKMPRATIFEIADAFKRGLMKGKADTVRKMQDRFNKVFGGMDATQGLLRRTFDKIAKDMLEGEK